jgi:hypothetical protein
MTWNGEGSIPAHATVAMPENRNTPMMAIDIAVLFFIFYSPLSNPLVKGCTTMRLVGNYFLGKVRLDQAGLPHE